MVSLVPGVLVKLLQHMNTDVKVAGEHRSSLLQVIGIVPALAGGDLYSNKGFYLKVSDSSHATYVTLPDEHEDLILSDKIQLGQYIHVERLEAASPVPILRGTKPIPGRHPCVGSPEDIVASRSQGYNTEKSRLSNASKDNDSPPLEKEKSRRSLAHINTERSRPSNVSKDNGSLPLEKEKNRSVKSNGSSKVEAEKKGLLNRCGSSVSKHGEAMHGRASSVSSRSIPSSPTSCYSVPQSFEKFSNGVKQQGKVKTVEKPASTRFNLLERAASVLKATTPGRKSSVGNAMGMGIDSGAKVLRKSWEGIVETKGRDSSTAKGAKTEAKTEARSKSVPRRQPLTNEKLSPKDDNKVQTPLKKGNANATSVEPDNSTKQRSPSPVVKRSQEVANILSSGSLVKISTSRRWTDGSVSWASLPLPLAKLGKEVMKYRDAAEQAAIEAMQEASAAESLVRCLSMYAELASTAKEDNPQPTVEQFLSFHSSLTKSALISNSLTPIDPATLSIDSVDPLLANLSSEKRRFAASWVNAALSTDLSPFSLFSPKSTPLIPTIILDSPSKSTAPQIKPKPSPPKKVKPRVSPSTLSPPVEWVRGGGTEEGAELAKSLKDESRTWFLGFVERFLDADVGDRLPWDRDLVAGMLSQLKKVNDWLDEVGRGEEEASGIPDVSAETVDRIRKKIYEYLLTHVESAAVALGGASSSVVERHGRRG